MISYTFRQLLNKQRLLQASNSASRCQYKITSSWRLHNQHFSPINAPQGDSFNLISDILRPWAIKKPESTALWLFDGNKSTMKTYKELLNDSQYFANALSQFGTLKCAQVVLPKIGPWWTVNLAASYIGMAVSPGTAMLTANEMAFRLDKSSADVIICDAQLKEQYKSVCKNIRLKIIADNHEQIEKEHLEEGWLSFHEMLRNGPRMAPIKCIEDGNALAQLFFTSGTTGKPKMVPHTQSSYGRGQINSCKYGTRLSESDVFWNLSDLGWAKAAYSNLYIPLITGCTIFVHQMERFKPKLILEALESQEISAICFPPTAYRSLVQENLTNFQTKCLQKCFSAGEPLNPDVIDTWKAHTGVTIREFYGQTETTILATTPEGSPVKAGSFGKPLPGIQLSVLDEDLCEVGANKTGQIAISLKDGFPDGLCKEYYKNPSQTEKSFIDDYYLTGDKAYKDEDGYFYYVGRHDDIIISAGYRIGPFEVESALIEHPAVLESAVVASPDRERGHIVKAFIILQDDYLDVGDKESLIEDIRSHMKQTIAPYKCPKKIEFVTSLPKTISGKIRRIELRQMEMEKN